MSSNNNPISHHTSHTMGNGASSSNGDDNWNCEASNANGHDQGDALEASLTDTVADPLNFTPNRITDEPREYDEDSQQGSALPCSSTNSVFDGDDSDMPTASNITSMYSSINQAGFNAFKIIDTTLREGEQFINSDYSTERKIEIARALDAFGVDYIELTSPVASLQSRLDCEIISKLGLKAKVLCHIRCNMGDARHAVESGVAGVNMCIGTSKQLMEHSHGKDMAYINDEAQRVIEFVKSRGLEIRFSGEDSFRSNFSDILKLYTTFDRMGINRVGIADTVGGATPMEVYEKIEALRKAVSCDIETHFHNDTGCAIANARIAVEAGATHIDTTVLGIGERNGITPLGGLMKTMMLTHRDYIMSKYNLESLGHLERLIARTVRIEIPFNNFVVSPQENILNKLDELEDKE
ncbi:homocitrate synthase [Annulohypoxylon maeteangense]|uniref:homocitrate synthase n=1 Tax=Annulohypoxylon maeteangense TaxID=1927788 RepID=UPI00200800B1|nr:homocitrate synthase [Annulohypoxylon maeteangense]KAI0886786.1 homocitrate synthase [Annulohypoxylon maeteangense]